MIKNTIGETFDLSLAEQIEVFRAKLEKTLLNSDLPISIIYLVLKDISSDLGREYEKFAMECRRSIEQKIKEEQELWKEQDKKIVEEMQQNGVNVRLPE